MLRASADSLHLTQLVPPPSTELDKIIVSHPLASLLSVDKVNVLLDCGATSYLTPEVANAIAPYGPMIDAVLLSSSELRSCGTLPYLIHHLRPDVPIFCTVAAAKLGRQNVISQLTARVSTTDMELEREVSVGFTIADVHTAFNRIRELHYDESVFIFSQNETSAQASKIADESSESDTHAEVSGERRASEAPVLQARAQPAGLCCGDAVWRLSYSSDQFLYAPVISTGFESHGVLSFKHDPLLHTTSALIGFPSGTQKMFARLSEGTVLGGNAASFADRLDTLFAASLYALRRGGNVLIPLNCYERGIDVLISLQRHFASRGSVYPLVFACPKARQIVTRLRTIEEFLPAEAFTEGEHPFVYENVQFANNAEEVWDIAACENSDGTRQQRKHSLCILGHTANGGEDGIAGALLQQILSDPHSRVICIDVPQPGSPCAELLERAPGYQKNELKFTYRERRLLRGEELDRHYENVHRYLEETRSIVPLEREADEPRIPQLGDDQTRLELQKTAPTSPRKDDSVAHQNSTHLLFPKTLGSNFLNVDADLLSLRCWRRSVNWVPRRIVRTSLSSSQLLKSMIDKSMAVTAYGVSLHPDMLDQCQRVLTVEQQFTTETVLGGVPEEQLQAHYRSAELADRAPATVTPVNVVIPRIECQVRAVDLSNNMEEANFVRVMGSVLRLAKRVAIFPSSNQDLSGVFESSDTHVLDLLSRQLKPIASEQHSVPFPNAKDTSVPINTNEARLSLLLHGQPLDLAIPLESMQLQLHPRVIRECLTSLQRVPSPSGHYEIGWVRAAIRCQQITDNHDEIPSDLQYANTGKRARSEDASSHVTARNQQWKPVVLEPIPSGEQLIATTEGTSDPLESSHIAGSIFVGDVTADNITDVLRQRGFSTGLIEHSVGGDDQQLPNTFGPTIPIVLGGDRLAVAVEPSTSVQQGRIILESYACPQIFDVREKLYNLFGSVL